MPSDAINIEELLRGYGLTNAQDVTHARAMLEQNGLTRPGRQNIARAKQSQVEELLSANLVRCCGGNPCREELTAGGETRYVAMVERRLCEVCGGSSTSQAFQGLVKALKAANVARLLLIGGTPNQVEDLRGRLPPGVTCEWVEGTTRVDGGTARMQINRSDLVIIWGPTPLLHKVSTLYQQLDTRDKTVVVKRRGIGALAEAIVTHVQSASRSR